MFHEFTLEHGHLSRIYVLVFDSWGKISDGILTGHFKWPGMYDECKNISVIPPANSTYLKDRLDTKYCTMSIPVIVSIAMLLIMYARLQ